MVRLLTVSEVASALRVHSNTVDRWCKDGRMSAVRLPGGGLRVPQDALDALLKPVTPPQQEGIGHGRSHDER